jgi:hypothetical protein
LSPLAAAPNPRRRLSLGSTSLFGLDYPDLTDAPNGPAQIQQLAEDTNGWLCRAFPCTSASRPTGVGTGFLIRESDTGSVLIWTGSAWAAVAGTVSGGGGGGGTSTISTVSATYAATAAQSIAPTTDVVVAFGVEQTADPLVTRSTNGAGHKFTLAQTRLWTVTATVRFAAATGGGRTFELRTGAGAVLAKFGDPVVDGPYTRTLPATRRLAAGTTVHVIARHDAAAAISLEPQSGDFCHIDIAGV